jgi:hypothetical protein
MNEDRPGQTVHGLLLGTVIFLIGIVLVAFGHQMSAEHGGEVINEAGFVVIGTVLVTYCYEYVLRRQHDRYLVDLIERSLIADAPKFGLVRFHGRFNFGSLFDDLEPGDELLWFDTYCPDQPNYLAQLRSAVHRGASVKLLAVTPDSQVARLRAKEIDPVRGFSVKRFQDEARGNLETLRDALACEDAKVRERVQVRLYDDLPCVPMYIRVHAGRPHTAIQSFFLRNPSFDRPHLEWRAASGGTLYDLYDYFVAKWEKFQEQGFDLTPIASVESDGELAKSGLTPEVPDPNHAMPKTDGRRDW